MQWTSRPSVGASWVVDCIFLCIHVADQLTEKKNVWLRSRGTAEWCKSASVTATSFWLFLLQLLRGERDTTQRRENHLCRHISSYIFSADTEQGK